MNDIINRQQAIDALKEHRALYCDNTLDAFSKLSYAEKSRVDELDTAIATLVNLPSAELKRGHWIKADVCGDITSWECSCCHNWTGLPTGWNVKAKLWFCPKCTADMREVNNESN